MDHCGRWITRSIGALVFVAIVAHFRHAIVKAPGLVLTEEAFDSALRLKIHECNVLRRENVRLSKEHALCRQASARRENECGSTERANGALRRLVARPA